MKKLLKWAAIAILLVAGIPVAALLLANLRDEELDPAAAAFIKTELPRVPDEQNAFYHLAGLAAALSENPHAAGRTWLAQVHATQARRLAGESAAWPEPLKGSPKLPALCSPERGDSCIQWLKEKPDARKHLAEHAQVVERYRSVHAYPSFADMTDARLYSYPIMAFLPSIEGQRLFLMDLARRFESGETDAALAALRDEIALGRRMMAGSRSILQKTVATSHLTRTTLFASDALATYREAIGPKAALLGEALRPLSTDERQLLPALRTELALMASALDPTRWRGDDLALGLDPMLMKPFYQHRASVNLLYQGYFRQLAELDSAPATQLDAALAKARAAEPQVTAWNLYNPVGKIFLKSAAPELTNFFDRTHDADALVRMVALQAAIVANRVKDEEIAAFTASQARSIANPYTGKAYDWDAKARQLYFLPRSKNLRERRLGGIADRVALTI